MIIELSLMIVSGAVISFLYFHNHLELNHGASTKMQNVRAKMDPMIADIKDKTNNALSYVTLRHFSIFLHNLFVYAARFFMHLSRKVHDSSARLAEKASQRREDLSKGKAASFYLKQIKDAKDNGDKPETGGDVGNM